MACSLTVVVPMFVWNIGPEKPCGKWSIEISIRKMYLFIHLFTLKRVSVGSKRYVQQYVLLRWPQSPSLDTLAFGKTLVTPSGTCPAKPGSTGVIPKDRIRSKILCCSCNWFVCQDDGRGPPQPRRFPILALLQTN